MCKVRPSTANTSPDTPWWNSDRRPNDFPRYWAPSTPLSSDAAKGTSLSLRYQSKRKRRRASWEMFGMLSHCQKSVNWDRIGNFISRLTFVRAKRCKIIRRRGCLQVSSHFLEFRQERVEFSRTNALISHRSISPEAFCQMAPVTNIHFSYRRALSLRWQWINFIEIRPLVHKLHRFEWRYS